MTVYEGGGLCVLFLFCTSLGSLRTHGRYRLSRFWSPKAIRSVSLIATQRFDGKAVWRTPWMASQRRSCGTSQHGRGAAEASTFPLRIPVLQIGPFMVASVVAAARPDQTYSETSFETPSAIVGALAGNVLSQFRAEIDYPDQLLFLDPAGKAHTTDFDTVGLVLDINTRRKLVVRAVSASASALTRRNVMPGDVILQVGNKSGIHTLTEASKALAGAVGEEKQLRILRDGKTRTVTVTVARIL